MTDAVISSVAAATAARLLEFCCAPSAVSATRLRVCSVADAMETEASRIPPAESRSRSMMDATEPPNSCVRLSTMAWRLSRAARSIAAAASKAALASACSRNFSNASAMLPTSSLRPRPGISSAVSPLAKRPMAPAMSLNGFAMRRAANSAAGMVMPSTASAAKPIMDSTLSIAASKAARGRAIIMAAEALPLKSRSGCTASTCAPRPGRTSSKPVIA